VLLALIERRYVQLWLTQGALLVSLDPHTAPRQMLRLAPLVLIVLLVPMRLLLAQLQ